MAQRLCNPLHAKRATCVCDECEVDRDTHGCENPHACATKAASRLGQIRLRWIPKPGDTERHEAEPMDGEETSGRFLPPDAITNLAQGLRAMTHRVGEPLERPEPPIRRRVRMTPIPEEITIYIAGTIHTPLSKKVTAAAGIIINAGDNGRNGKCIPVDAEQSQYVAEFYAALEAIRSANKNTTLTIVSAQPYVRDAMNKKLAGWEHEGWVAVQHRNVLRCVAAELKARTAPTFLQVAAQGTPARAECKRAAGMAKRAASPDSNGVGPHAAAGHGPPRIREEKTKRLAPRASTTKNLEAVRVAVYDTFDRRVSDADIWRSMSVKDFLPRTAQFLWKGMHNAHRIGSYWAHIPECKDRAVCKNCEVTEDLEHILVGCDSPGQKVIWRAAKSLWLEKESQWPEVSLGTILGCGLAEFHDGGKTDRGAQRLYRILISESAYLIWRLRNDRVISRSGEPATEDEIINKWKFAVNQRLQMDKLLANRPRKRKRPALAPALVLETWSNTLDNERSLPADWLREPRVLVGSRAFPQAPARQQNSRGIGIPAQYVPLPSSGPCLWEETLADQFDVPNPLKADAVVLRCRSLLLENGDQVNINKYIIYSLHTKSGFGVGCIEEILVDIKRDSVLGVVVSPCTIGLDVLPYRLPSCTMTVSPKVLLAFEVSWATPEQSGTELEQEIHFHPEDCILNLAQLQSATHVQRFRSGSHFPKLGLNEVIEQAIHNKGRLEREAQEMQGTKEAEKVEKDEKRKLKAAAKEKKRKAKEAEEQKMAAEPAGHKRGRADTASAASQPPRHLNTSRSSGE
ncbi:hypothetical protein B0H10DRAFT_1950974 [Mycena sp. CBHHK59/15]|nr:hypothetical protein B0H10DRAFT_1950974 [Mycena sp. CBHHK59/15]